MFWTLGALFKASFAKADPQSCAQEVTGACCGSNLRTCWSTSVVKEAAKLKKDLDQTILVTPIAQLGDKLGNKRSIWRSSCTWQSLKTCGKTESPLHLKLLGHHTAQPP